MACSPDWRPKLGLGARRLIRARLAGLGGLKVPLSSGCKEDMADVATGGGGLRKSRKPGRQS